MNTLNRLLRFGLLGLLSAWSCGCNNFADRQPQPESGPPPASIQVLTRQYPQAQAVLFTTLSPNQLWQATFTQQNQRYQALISPTRLLTADRFVAGNLPDSLTRILAATVIAGGRLTNPRMRHWEYGRSLDTSRSEAYAYADYNWQQQAYTLRWSLARPQPAFGVPYYNLNLLPARRDEYTTDVLSDLPVVLQTIVQQQALTFVSATVQVEITGKRCYGLSVNRQGSYWWLSYDDVGKLLAVSNPATAQFFQQVDQLPAAAQQYLQRPELAGFTLSGPFSRHTYEKVSTYAVNLRKDKQVWNLQFSEQGELVSRSFLTYGAF